MQKSTVMAEQIQPRPAAAAPEPAMFKVVLAIWTTEEFQEHGGHSALYKAVCLPYLPRVGDSLAVGPGGDFLEVRSFFWSPEDGYQVWFDEPVTPGMDKFIDDRWTGQWKQLH